MKTKRKFKQSEVDSHEDCQRRLRTALARGNWKDAAEIRNQLGNLYRLAGQFDEALEQHGKEVNLCKKYNTGDKMGLGIAYRNLGEVYIDMKDEDKAILYIQQYLKVAREEKNCVEEQRALITLGRTYLCMADKEGTEDDSDDRAAQLDLAEENFRKAYKLIDDRRLKDHLKNEKELMTMKCNNCQNLAVVLEATGKLTEAVMWFSKAVEIGKKCNLYEYLHPCYSVLSAIYLKVRNANEALTAARGAVAAAKAQGSLTMEVESLILEAKTLFCMNEVDNGKKILKKVRKRIAGKDALVGYIEDLDTLLVAAIKVVQRQDAVFGTDPSDYSTLMKLHEELGDNYANLSNFSEALNHYMKAVEFAEACSVSGKKLSRLYFSIAETYKDKGEYSKALDYYRKEMELHSGNPEEKFKTLTNITVVMEKLGMGENELIEAYKTAIDLAKETKSVKREATAYQNLGFYYKTINKEGESAKMLEMVEKMKKKYKLADLEESEADSQDVLDQEEIDLNNLSSDEESDEDENSEDKKRVRGKKKVSRRRNEAGETPLHLAAKRGDIKAVRRLIRQCHEVHIRDLAGWTPLHEAANFGNVDIVAELLKHGAKINDKGGTLCEKITPLHDAAGNGHFAVINLLIENGADVLAIDKNENYPMDHLIMWRYTNGTDIEGDEYDEYKRIKHLLKDKMEEKGQTYTRQEELLAAKQAKKNNSKTEYSVMKARGKGEDEAIPVRIAGDDFDPDNVNEATEMYRSTIKGLMRRDDGRKTRSKKTNVRAISPGPRNALIPDAINLADNWLAEEDGAEGIEGGNTSRANRSNRRVLNKRKRDPIDDIIFREENVRRRRNGRKNEVSGMDLPRRNRIDSDSSSRRSEGSDGERPSSPMELENDESDPVIELQDLGETPTGDAGTSFGRSTSSRMRAEDNSHSPVLSPEENLQIIRDELLSSNRGGEEERPGLDEVEDMDFLPSQMPSTSQLTGRGIVFGRMNDAEDSSPLIGDSEESVQRDDEGNMGSRRSQEGGRVRSRPVHTISSSDEECFRENQNAPRDRNQFRRGNTFSSVASKVSKQGSSGRVANIGISSSSSGFTTQGRLPFKKILVGNRSESSPSPEMRRTSTSSLRQENEQLEQSKKTAGEGLRLKVRVLEHTLLVPVSDAQIDETVQWLCEQCAIRYMQTQGVKPILTLSTKDGAQLSGSDPISLVLGGTELELVANVTSYDLPPLTQRLQHCCSELKIVVDSDVSTAMNMCQSSNILTLTDLNLRGNLTRAVFQSLQREHSLRELILSGCSLFDEGLKELCKVLNTLPGLTVLDLSSNGIIATGLEVLAESFAKNPEDPVSVSKGPLGLTSLDLSHNPLGNRSARSLTQLISTFTNLKSLAIADCNFTDKLFLANRNDLASSFSKSKVEDLDVSYNDWGEVGMERLLQCLSPTRLRSLNCNSPGTKDDGSILSKVFTNFLTRNEDCCNLKELKLADSGVTDRSITDIIPHFNRLVSLESLDLSCNYKITVVSVEEILSHCQINEIPLTRLDVGNCPSLWDRKIGDERIILALDRKLQTDRKMNYLRLTVDGNPNYEGEEEESSLSELETRISRLWDDYAGTLKFSCKREGNCTIFKYE